MLLLGFIGVQFAYWFKQNVTAVTAQWSGNSVPVIDSSAVYRGIPWLPVAYVVDPHSFV